MTEIVSGKIVYNDQTANANGGTELMCRRMQRDINPTLLEDVQIVHSRFRSFEDCGWRVLVLHDLPSDPESENIFSHNNKHIYSRFDLFVFVSHWQMQQYINYYPHVPFFDHSVVIANAIEPIEYQERNFSDTIKLIYHTTPHRGLSLLVPAVKALSSKYDISLDVFSSFKVYGWEQADEQYKELFDIIDSQPNITNYGFQPNPVIRNELTKSHVFAYPCIWTETSCLALIEALCAGNIALHPTNGALVETACGWTSMYVRPLGHQHHYKEFVLKLDSTLSILSQRAVKSDAINTMLSEQSKVCNRLFNWHSRVPVWEHVLRCIKEK